MQRFFVKTPMVRAAGLAGEVFFKLENLQPSGSFKIRGVSHMISTIADRGILERLVCSSGGNAGLAVATVGKQRGVPVDVYVPETTKPNMVQKLKALGASVFVGGENWNAADAFARLSVDPAKGFHYIPPYDDPLLWEGHASIIDEMVEEGNKPDVIVLSVGGGGLLCGVQRGLERNGWGDVEVVAVETQGAASFAAAKAAGHPVMIPGIDSIATSLGARSVTQGTLDTSIITKPFQVSDAEAVDGCLTLLNEYRFLVEPACGASVAAVVHPRFKEVVADHERKKVCVIVCGGSNVNLDSINEWKKMFNL
jgi:L-serine/L-threonine ammonia-lyase